MMTGSARNLPVSGEDRIPKEQPPQLHFLRGLGVVRRRGDIPGQGGEREVIDGPFEAIPAAVSAVPLPFTQIRETEHQYNVEVVGYVDAVDSSPFKMSLLQDGGTWIMYASNLFHRGWSILDVTDPADPKVLKFIEGPENTGP